MDLQRLLDGLDPAQRRAVTSDAAPLAVIAGAGSGKTRVLTRRIARRCLDGTADPRHVLAVTFTRKAAAELDSRLASFGLRDLPAAGTFHALAYAQLRGHWAETGRSAPVLLDRKARVLSRIIGSSQRMSAGDVASEIEWAKAKLVAPERYRIAAAQADRRVPVPPEVVAGWYQDYEDHKRRAGLVDFDDLLSQCASAIEQNPSFAAAQRWRFRHLFVDEYQDVNPLQDRLLRAWLGDGSDLCVVGDPRQAIYGWNGADPSFLLDVAAHHRGTEVIDLIDNYRSTPQVLAAAAAVLDDTRWGGSLRANRQDGPSPTVTVYADEKAEAEGIARAVHDLNAPGRPWSSQAVLVRTNAQALVIEEAFRRATIPYRLKGASAFLDDLNVRELLRGYERMSQPLSITLEDLDASIAERRASLLEDQVDPSADDMAEAASAFAASAEGRRLAAWEGVLRLGRDLLTIDRHARTDAFGGWLRTILREDGDGGGNAVTIASFHAAKGLEWPVVHLAGLEAGYMPITHARTPEAQEEERRLLYVAVTRAGEILRASWARQRTFGSRTVERRPSPWLAAVASAEGSAGAPSDAGARPAARADALQAARSRLRGGSSDRRTDSVLREALHSWRSSVARGASVAPTVVLAERSLDAVVRHRPQSPQALAEVAEMGPVALDRWGADLLALVADHRGAPVEPGDGTRSDP